MKRLLLAFALGAMMVTTAQAQTPIEVITKAQLNLGTVQQSKDPLTGLDAKSWISLATNLVDGSAVQGKPFIYMLNGTGRELTAVTCDGKWQLVGPTPYTKGAPGRLKPWRATLVPTTGFDGYCKKSITAQSDDGTTYETKLVSPDGTFSAASFITIMP